MKKNKLLKIVIAIIVIILAVITYFTFFAEREVLDNVGYIFKLDKNANVDMNINYKDKYNENIINEKISSYNYEILHDDSSLYGKIYIDDEGYLNISDDFTNVSKRINNEKYNSIFRNITYRDKLIVYGLSDTKKLYKFVLETSNINDIKYYELQFKNEVTNFTDLNVNTISSNEIIPIVLCSDNKMYVADYELLYNTNYYIFYDKYVIFDDNTIALTNGKMIVDADGENVKASAYITFDEKVFDSNPNVAIVTNVGELLFKYSDNEIYSYNKLIDTMEGYETIKLNFYDDTWLSFKGEYHLFYKKTES